MDIEKNPSPEHIYQYEDEDESTSEKLNQMMDTERQKIRDAITTLSKLATLTVADSYEIEEMGVELLPNRQFYINEERIRLNRGLGEMLKICEEFEVAIGEVQRGVGSLQYMIDPENN